MKPQHDSNQDPYSAPQVYYGTTFASERKGRINTYSINLQRSLVGGEWDESGYRPKYTHARRGSYDETMLGGRKFLVNVDTALEKLRMQEDTDGNLQITIEDKGPKVFSLGTASSNGFRRADIRGTYQLSNLLQELLFAKEYGRRQIILDEARLNENPINRIYRLIKDSFWPELTRDMSEAGIETAFGSDNEDSASPLQRRIYVPRSAPEQYDFYGHLSQRRPELGISVEWIENNITPEYVKSIKERPGLLALATADPEQDRNAKEGIKFLPYITSGRKRDQFHGWDSYFNVLGLLSHEEIKLALSLVEHFCFCIKHYGHVPQGNRSYYLTRSSPPFLTDMALRVYNKIKHEEYALAFLRRALLACIKEYHAVWMMPPRFDPITNLSRYRTGGAGIPTDLQVDLAEQLKSYATKYGMSLDAFTDAYNAGVVEDGDLYTFLMHERAMQESGHSFSSRFRGRCANLVTIDLNSLLYKYEKDIAQTIKLHFADRFEVPADICVGNMPAGGYIDRSTLWERRARRRKLAIDRYLWNEGKKMYFDYDTVKREQSTSESATAFWPLWAGLASPAQAQQLVSNAIPRFEATGGISATTEESRGLEASERQNVQWDYPYGWAPHQVLLWSGLAMYGYQDVAERLAYKWLFAIIKSFVDYSGVIEESYDVTRVMDPQRRSIGRDHQFLKGVLKDRSTWVSASFVCGLQIANQHQIRCLGAMVPWDTVSLSIEK
ncbi:neutral trehalase [Cadophora sp. MPI-SDFR-AT-0126]|nr:neutral trehalase [Leotiomycetes sp. MPI-SDFR-AT-0126]